MPDVAVVLEIDLHDLAHRAEKIRHVVHGALRPSPRAFAPTATPRAGRSTEPGRRYGDKGCLTAVMTLMGCTETVKLKRSVWEVLLLGAAPG